MGSEGTLVTILEATLNLVPKPAFHALMVLGYQDIYQAGDAVSDIVELKPIGLEGIDHKLIENMRKKGLHLKYLDQLPEGRGFLLVQFPGESQAEANGRADELIAKLRRSAHRPNIKLYEDKADEKGIWALARVRGGRGRLCSRTSRRRGRAGKTPPFLPLRSGTISGNSTA